MGRGAGVATYARDDARQTKKVLSTHAALGAGRAAGSQKEQAAAFCWTLLALCEDFVYCWNIACWVYLIASAVPTGYIAVEGVDVERSLGDPAELIEHLEVRFDGASTPALPRACARAFVETTSRRRLGDGVLQ